MNQYELAVLRILLKSPAPLSKSKVVDGFPDDSSDFVLSAISDLKEKKFILVSQGSPGSETLELAKEKKKDVLGLLGTEPGGIHPGAKSDRKEKSEMRTTAMLVAVATLASVYAAYAIGVNERVAAQQPIQYPAEDITLRFIQLRDGRAIAITGESVFEQRLQDRGGVVLSVPPDDVLVKYYGTQERMPLKTAPVPQ